MTDTPGGVTTRPDVDLLEDVQNVFIHYPPMVNDRHHVTVEVSGGTVILRGVLKTPITRRYLVNQLEQLAAVQGVNTDALYDDEALRHAVGQVLPVGVVANLDYGTVILSGTLPDDDALEALVEQISTIPGIKRIVARGL